MSERPNFTEIALGHGVVDVAVVNLDGRYGLFLKPRSTFVPVGEQVGPVGAPVTLDGGPSSCGWTARSSATPINAIRKAQELRAGNA